jgi:N-methylhydantoinase B
VSLRPASEAARKAGAQRAEVLTFNCGGSGARPHLDGMNTTAFPSGVMTMPIEATEHTGPIIIWRKELRPNSGGAGRYRGGLGQYMEIGAVEGHVFDISAMFDRVKYPPRGRRGGGNGAATEIALDDGTVMAGKGRQFVPEGRKVRLSLPGGAGYAPASERSRAEVLRDLALGYISPEMAKNVYRLTESEALFVAAGLKRGELPARDEERWDLPVRR